MAGSASIETRVRPRNLLGVLAFLRRYARETALSISLLLVNITIELVLPQVIGRSIDQLRHGLFDPWTSVSWFIGLVTARAVVGWILGPIRNRAIQHTLNDIRAAIFDATQRLGFRYHDRSNTGELISRSTTDIGRLQDFFFACLFLTVDIVVALVVTTVLIFLVDGWLGTLAVATMIPTIGLIGYFASQLQPQWRRVHDLHGAMTTVVQENIAGVRVVKAFAKEWAEVAKFRAKKDDYLVTLGQTVNYWAARVPLAQFIFGLGLPLILWVGGRQVVQGTLSLGELATVVLYVMALGHRVGMIGQFTNIIQNASASAERILEVIHEPREIRDGPKQRANVRGEVIFSGVHFAYEKGKAALQAIDVCVRPGETVAIVGPTGSGKSTLVQLIPRFYDPTAGCVRVDGVDVKEWTLSELRRAVAVVFQETFLFSATVADNIAFGRPGASRNEIRRCAKAARAHEFILELAEGYDTVIGERGVSLSGGQRQRIALARALLMDPRILILDDATASVDSQTERQIQAAMVQLCRGRTSFIIAQRFSTVKHADRILVLQEGRVVEAGTHDELIGRGGFYSEMVRAQSRH